MGRLGLERLLFGVSLLSWVSVVGDGSRKNCPLGAVSVVGTIGDE